MKDDELGHDELTDSERRALGAWPAMAPQAGFADRVIAAHEREREREREREHEREREGPAAARLPGAAPRRWPRIAGTVAAGTAAAAAVAWVALAATRPASQAARGSLVAAGRTEARLGARAVAVAEADAALDWRIAADGAAEIDQTTGNVFYRVDRGGPFVVHTPAGDVRVTGTCFRIEVEPMSKKHILVSGAAGAAIAAAVVVTVYEGHVIAETKAARTELSAGSQATIGGDGRATVAAISPSEAGAAPAARSLAEDARATREELIARTGEQRVEIGQLRARIAELEQRSGARTGTYHPDNSAEEGRAWYDPSPERLAQWATECHVRADLPNVDRWQPMPPNAPNDRGIEPSEIPAINAAQSEIMTQWKQLLRALYIEATGDAAGADQLSLDAMRGEIQEKSPPGEYNLILQKIARERAGLATPPVDLSKLSPLERMMRAYVELGNQAEAAIAKRLGKERAKEIRGEGWSSRSDWSGCPG